MKYKIIKGFGLACRMCGTLAAKKPRLIEEAAAILTQLKAGNRTTLSKAITLTETRSPTKKLLSNLLIDNLVKASTTRPTFRIGLSGSPGAGKSTLIESLGSIITGKGLKLAVLAVDPSSQKTGGSLLGDKTRMTELSRNPLAFIRPSPSDKALGGVSRTTHESILLCEAAGYDVIIAETVGVGQSEITVASMVDMFCLLVPPAAGDDLQGIKRGIVESADLVVITKADGDLKPAARRVQQHYSAALRLLRPRSKALAIEPSIQAPWRPKVTAVSALDPSQMESLWSVMSEYWDTEKATGSLQHRRQAQLKDWLNAYLDHALSRLFIEDSVVREAKNELEKQVETGQISPGHAADQLVGIFKNNLKS